MLVFTPRMRNSRSARSVALTASSNVVPQVVTFTSSESKYGVMTAPPKPLPPSRRTREPAGRAVGRDPAVVGDEVVLRIFGRDAALHRDAAASRSAPAAGCSAAARAACGPAATRIWLLTRSMPVTTSVTVCSTWMRGLTSMKKNSLRSTSSRNSTVPALR